MKRSTCKPATNFSSSRSSACASGKRRPIRFRSRNSTVDVPRGPFHVRYPMPHPLEELRDSALREIAETQDESALEALRVRYLGRSGSISVWGEQMKTLSKEERPVVGQLLNEARTVVTAALAETSERLRADREASALADIDISLPGTATEIGALHP